MKGISLYSGGCDGMSLAASWAGISTLALCESDKDCRVILRKHHKDIPIFELDTEVTLDSLKEKGIDINEIDIVYGGPPCQCASVAGKRQGIDDERNRWPEFLRIVREIKPRWCLAENVTGILSVNDGRLFGGILRELAEAGYDVGWQGHTASVIGAPHKRERLFIMAYRISGGFSEPGILLQQQGRAESKCGSKDVGNSEYNGQFAAEIGKGITEGSEYNKKRAQCTSEFERPDKQCRELEYSESSGLGGQKQRREQAGFNSRRFDEDKRELEYSNKERLQESGVKSSKWEEGQCTRRFSENGYKGSAKPRLARNVNGLSSWMDRVSRRLLDQRWPMGRSLYQYGWEPPRVAENIKNRAKRIKMLGNSCPPQQYYPWFEAIKTFNDYL